MKVRMYDKAYYGTYFNPCGDPLMDFDVPW